MKKLFAIVAMAAICSFGVNSTAFAEGESGDAAAANSSEQKATDEKNDTAQAQATAAAAGEQAEAPTDTVAKQKGPEEEVSIHKTLKTKFIEGGAGFMALVAIALVLGLALCIERIIYLSLAQINTRKFISDLGELVAASQLDEAVAKCEGTRGPVAKISTKALKCLNSDDQNDIQTIERTINMEAEVQGSYLEENLSWITLFIAMAPSLGFLGTVIGMVQAFDDIQKAGDISPTVVAGGMKVALITTIFGIVVALILQIFYNYILSRVESLTSNMEEAAQDLLVICVQSPKCNK